MPVLITALLAIGIQAAALVGKRLRRASVARPAAVAGVDLRPVGARRPRLISRRPAA
jgi:hypothetical protein